MSLPQARALSEQKTCSNSAMAQGSPQNRDLHRQGSGADAPRKAGPSEPNNWRCARERRSPSPLLWVLGVTAASF